MPRQPNMSHFANDMLKSTMLLSLACLLYFDEVNISRPRNLFITIIKLKALLRNDKKLTYIFNGEVSLQAKLSNTDTSLKQNKFENANSIEK